MEAARYQGGEIVGALDVGTSKIACMIFETAPPKRGVVQPTRVLGLGHQRSRGLKAGVITDTKDAEAAMRAAIAQAERCAGVTLDEVFVAITCGRIASLSFAAHAEPDGGVVGGSDITRLYQGARAYAERDGRVLIHMNRKQFRLDGVPGGDDPRGLATARLSADMHAVTADGAAISNLLHVVERCHLSVAGLVAAPFASALATTSEDERQLGVTVIDLGSGTTSWAAFDQGQFVNCEVLATGGHHLTFDIAQNLRCSLAEAERIKALYASMVNAASDVGDRFCYTPLESCEGGQQQMSRAELCEVVRPRMETLLPAVAGRLRAAGLANGQVVLTGGASQLVGLVGFAQACFGVPVRLGRPPSLTGLATGADSPAFAAAVGLGLIAPSAVTDALDEDRRPGVGYLSRVGRWIGSGL